MVRRNSRGRSSQRTMLDHLLTFSGRSRWLEIHFAKKWLMIVSLVGRTTSGSSSSLPPPWVTTASSGLKPSTCSASRRRNALGISIGK